MTLKNYLSKDIFLNRNKKRKKETDNLSINSTIFSKSIERKYKMCLNTNQITLPPAFSLNDYRNFIYNQGDLGSCTANAFCAAYRIMNNIQNKNILFQPSRLFFYYQERDIEGTVNTDSGANVINGEKYVKSNGICSEESWPYIISNFNIKPPLECYTEAINYKISSYDLINLDSNLLTNIKNAIYNKQPVLIAIVVYSSFESESVATTGLIPIPDITQEEELGGHEMCLIGYDDTTELFTVMNSWGSSWGHDGLCYIPYNYLSNELLGIEFSIFNL
jgi:C1A family cysteine protease